MNTKRPKSKVTFGRNRMVAKPMTDKREHMVHELIGVSRKLEASNRLNEILQRKNAELQARSITIQP